jgi:hypothetical protein
MPPTRPLINGPFQGLYSLLKKNEGRKFRDTVPPKEVIPGWISPCLDRIPCIQYTNLHGWISPCLVMIPCLLTFTVEYLHVLTWSPVFWPSWLNISMSWHDPLSTDLHGWISPCLDMIPCLLTFMVEYLHVLTWSPVYWPSWLNISMSWHDPLSTDLHGWISPCLDMIPVYW